MTDLKHPQQNKNFAIAKGPVNRRTAPPLSEPKPNLPAAVKARLQHKALRHRLGTPLAQQVATSTQPNATEKPLRTTHILQAVGASAGAVGVVLGAVQSALIWLLGGAAVLVGVALWGLILKRKVAPERIDNAQAAIELIAVADLQRLDALMETLASQSPPATVQQLAGLKAGLVRCIALLASEKASGTLAGEDPLYIGEAVRRYIPDTINACLQVPAKDRATLVLDNGQTVVDLLHAQLALIGNELALRETRLSQAVGEQLLRQQRFLAAKSAQRV